MIGGHDRRRMNERLLLLMGAGVIGVFFLAQPNMILRQQRVEHDPTAGQDNTNKQGSDLPAHAAPV